MIGDFFCVDLLIRIQTKYNFHKKQIATHFSKMLAKTFLINVEFEFESEI